MISVFKSNFSSYASLHKDAVTAFCKLPKKRKYVISKFDNAVRKHFNGIVSDFAELISATPDILFQLKVHYDKKSKSKKEEIKRELNLEGLYDIFIDKKCPFKVAKIQYNSNVLAKGINIKTCPYCNENTAYTFYYKTNRRYRRTFDWDHVIPKKEYPFLAMSFFNLIPACKVCNQLKNNKSIRFSPHMDFNPDKIYSYFVKGINSEFISDPKSLKLMLRVNKNVNGKAILHAMSVTGTDARISTQLDLVQDILNKKRIYESSYWPALEKFVSGTTNNRLSPEALLFSVYFNHQDYYKRPYSKLTSDLIRNKKK